MEFLTFGLALAGVVVGILWAEGSKFFKKKLLTQEQLVMLYELARTAVSAAETAGYGMTGDQKYKLAAEGLVELACRLGVELKPSEVAVIIHAVLAEVQAPREAA